MQRKVGNRAGLGQEMNRFATAVSKAETAERKSRRTKSEQREMETGSAGEKAEGSCDRFCMWEISRTSPLVCVFPLSGGWPFMLGCEFNLGVSLLG